MIVQTTLELDAPYGYHPLDILELDVAYVYHPLDILELDAP